MIEPRFHIGDIVCHTIETDKPLKNIRKMFIYNVIDKGTVFVYQCRFEIPIGFGSDDLFEWELLKFDDVKKGKKLYKVFKKEFETQKAIEIEKQKLDEKLKQL